MPVPERNIPAAEEVQGVGEVRAMLGFCRPEEVSDDAERTGLLRATSRPIDTDFDQQFELHSCRLHDWSTAAAPTLNLGIMGFDSIDLSTIEPLQSLLENIRSADKFTADDARTLRHIMRGRTFRLGGGKCLKVLSIAPEGMIMRKGGPNGLKVDPDIAMTEMNGHDAATSVHGDQDVYGTPLKQMMRGFAPWLFRHQTPDGNNRFSPLLLVNVWIPLQQITRPLTLMDRRSLDPLRHQIRYSLPTEAFLDRSEETRCNDIWTFLHDAQQQWYFNAEMGPGRAYVFDTLGEPHGAVILPGEELAEYCYLTLQALCKQLGAGERPDIPGVVKPDDLPTDTTTPLRRAIEDMAALIAQVPTDPTDDIRCQQWQARARSAMDRVVRKSLEMRGAALLLPDVWPFNRGL